MKLKEALLNRCPLAIACLASVVLGSGSAHGQGTAAPSSPPGDASPVELEVFEGPKAKRPRVPDYPFSERVANHEGWVQLNFMIDPSGKPYEIVVTDSSGNKDFEREAIKALQLSEYEPATLGGKPVDASHTMKVTFVLTGPGGGSASPKFVRTFEKLRRAIAKGDKSAADVEFAKLGGENLYELAYAAVAKYEYHVQWGSEKEQMEALGQAVAHEATASYLPKDLFNAVLQALLLLQVNNLDYADALETWTIMQKSGVDPATLARLQPTMDEVAKLRTDDRSFVVQRQIDADRFSWVTNLHKKKFYVGEISGKLVEIKLRCDKKYVFLPFEPDLEYRIGDKYGTCSLELVGDPGTTFKLVQS